jgi:protein CpxP
MKPPLLLLLLTIGAGLNSAYAQSPSQSPTSTPQADTVRRSASDVVDMLAKKLSLSDDQKSKILPIIADRRQKTQAVREDPSANSRQQLLQARSIMEESDKRINLLLTPEQRQAYAQVEQQMRAQMKARRAQGAAAT